jgi:hypothetical protein
LLLAAALALPAAALSIAGCGLESILLLYPPDGVNAGSSLSGTFQFRSTTDNNEPAFLGFEVYYRIYLGSEIPPSYYESRDDLVANSYHRLNNPALDSPGNTNPPLVFVDPADRGDIFDVAINFLVDLSIYPQLTVTGATGLTTTTQIDTVRRSVGRSTPNEFQRFTEITSDDVSASNSDVTQAVFESVRDGIAVNINCFAVSFGNDFGTIVYSQPEWLGYKVITLPYNP